MQMQFARGLLFAHVAVILSMILGFEQPILVVIFLFLFTPLIVLYPIAVIYGIFIAVTRREALRWFDYLGIVFVCGVLLLESL